MINVFCDTSALFAGIWSSEGGGRLILRLAEAELIQLQVSPAVLSELEQAIKAKRPKLLEKVAILLDLARVKVVPTAKQSFLGRSQKLVRYRADALVLAAAWQSKSDYFVTLDARHFLGNQALRREAPFEIGTPGDFIRWFRKRLEPMS